jgi:hypothetical protein
LTEQTRRPYKLSVSIEKKNNAIHKRNGKIVRKGQGEKGRNRKERHENDIFKTSGLAP